MSELTSLLAQLKKRISPGQIGEVPSRGEAMFQLTLISLLCLLADGTCKASSISAPFEKGKFDD